MKAETRRKVMLELTVAAAKSEVAQSDKANKAEAAEGRSTRFKGSNGCHYSEADRKTFPDSFLGREHLITTSSSSGDGGVGSLPSVYVKWKGAERWKGDDPLFFGPDSSSFGFPPLPFVRRDALASANGDSGATDGGSGSDKYVKIEDLCWVLQPAELCEKVTGKVWKQVELEMNGGAAGSGKDGDDNDEDEDSAASTKVTAFRAQCQLASYFVSQLGVLCSMCLGRSTNCIAFLERAFPYASVRFCYER
jgi:hypothetical protein